MINRLRKKKQPKVKKHITKFNKEVWELSQLVSYLYDLCETNSEAKKLIKQEIDYNLLLDLYEAFSSNNMIY